MLRMTRKKLSKILDVERVRGAIRDAERQTSGEIRVSVAPLFWGSVRRAAERAFVRMGMTATRERNGILFFIVPSRRAFAVLGDEGIHAAVGQEFWDAMAGLLSEHFRKGAFTEGLVAAIAAAGDKLKAHFPYDPATDRNELPDEVDLGRPRRS
ncbi:MAG: TPM domain-containing protein [Candidatus Aminicenantes bacterium]|nr:TPM domain-containing protein [Candidatus Aminicenantes bacterium]